MLISLLDWHIPDVLVGFGIDDRIEIPVGESRTLTLRVVANCAPSDTNASTKGNDSPIFPIAIRDIPQIINPDIQAC